jgi:Protein of unknown function (DUF3617)
MKRLVAFCLAAGCLALLAAAAASADEMPLRKPGLWEMRVVRAGSPLPQMTMQQCTDDTTDKTMSTALSPLSREVCSRRDIRKTATGYTADAVCNVGGVSMSTHSEISGDFNSAYMVRSTSHGEGGPKAASGDHVTTIEAKWLGACKPDQKPGDVVMPGGFKLNSKDIDKLKSLLPKK